MADIFISYTREDLACARAIAHYLEHEGWTVFWDQTIPAGKTWREVVGKELAGAKCVLVLWSSSSIESRWVQEEADEGERRGILVPALLEDVLPPIGFRSIQAADLKEWDPKRLASLPSSFLADIASVAGGPFAGKGSLDKAMLEQASVRSDAPQAPLKSDFELAANMVGSEPRALGGAYAALIVASLVVVVLVVSFSLYLRQAKLPGTIESTESPMQTPATVLNLRDDPKATTRPQESLEELQDCSICPIMVVVPAGHFTMGSPTHEPERDADEGPAHKVRVRAFAIGRFEVTFAEFDHCVQDGACDERPDDQGWGRGTRPVMNVSWNEAQSYVKWLSRRTGASYRLPSEAEWEYAARADTSTPFFFGETISADQANYNSNHSYNGGPTGEYLGRTAPIGSYPGNAFGLHDMHGNVWEWVADCWQDNYASASGDGDAHMGDDPCNGRILRGGSWYNKPHSLRAANRFGVGAGNKSDDIGFRVTKTLSP